MRNIGSIVLIRTAVLVISVLVINLGSASAFSTNCPAPVAGGFTACFYDNVNLSGNPVLVRTDSQINFNWGTTPPDSSLPNSYSVRWQGNFIFDAGVCTFTATTSDGMRVYIDNNNILDRWRDQPPYMYTLRPTLTPGTHLITVEYYQQTGWGIASLLWQPVKSVGQAPVISSFTASPSVITPGQPAMLSWNVSGATAVTIDNGVGNVSSVTSKSVSPTQTTTYTLTATNNSGSVTAHATVSVGTGTVGQILLPANVTVAPGDSAPFQVTLASPAPSNGVFITLISSDPSKVTVGPENIFIPQGSSAPSRAPTVNGINIGSAIITASASGLSPASGKVQVGPNPPVNPAPTITSFSATPSTITAGQPDMLSWSVSGANTINIDHGIGDVSSVISKPVSPIQTTTYILTATNTGGSSTAQVTVTVNSAPDTQPPTAPTLVSAIAKGPTEVDLAWTASTDNVGVAGYQISRNGSVLTSVSSASLSYADTSVSANATYTYSLKAYDAAGNYSTASNSVQVTTPSTSGSTIITSCGPITQSGHYVLGGNLSAPSNASCINIHDAHDIYLDCQQHGITIDRSAQSLDSAIVVTNVTNYSITNCALTALNTSSAASVVTLSVANSPHGVIANNAFSGGYVNLLSSDLEIARNTSDAPFYVAGDNEKIEDNTIVLKPSRTYSAVLALGNSGNSSGSMVQRNVFNGGWDGVAGQSSPFPVGADDGILLGNVSNTVVQNNTVLNAWDAGIENAGPMVNVQILDNQITTVSTGIGGWYGDSLKNVTLTGNTVTDASYLFLFFRADGFASGETSIFFFNTNVTNNKLVKPRMSSSLHARFDFLDLPAGIPASALVSGNNKFTNNDFGPGNPPRLLPAGSIVDGGGNICIQDSTPGFPLQCTPPTVP